MTKSEDSRLAGQGGERRNITVAFVDIVDSSALAAHTDAEDLSEWLEGYYLRTRQIVEKRGGIVTEYLGDGVVACFGLRSADELAASRAVDAALEAIEPLEPPRGWDKRVSLRIGVATGEVATRINSDITGLPPATGLVTTLACRIQEAAQPGEILIADKTEALLRGGFGTVAQPGYDLKGFSSTRTLFRVSRTVGAHKSPESSVFVGREEERETLLSAQTPRLIVGEAGIGKTALAHAVVDPDQHRVWLGADGLHLNSSHFPFKTWLQQIFGNEEISQERLTAKFPSFEEDQILALALVLGLPAGQQLLIQMANVTLNSLIERSLVEALLSQTPVDGWIVFEDLHWLDNASFGAVRALLTDPRAQQYRILLVSREDAKLDSYLDGLDLCRLTLAPLSDAESKSLIHSLAGQEIPGDEMAVLTERAGGIPLFLEHLYKRGASSEQGVPSSLMDLLADRIDSAGVAKITLQFASVMGRRFHTDILADLVPDGRNCAEDLSYAETLGVVARDRDGVWQFSHALLHQAAYHGVLRRVRENYHSQTARLLSERFATHEASDPTIIAWHHAQARELQPAILGYLQASQMALFRGAMADAEQHTRSALALCDTAPPQQDMTDLEIACHTSLGSVLMQVQGFSAPQVIEAFETVQNIARAAGRPVQNSAPALFGSFSHAIIAGNLDRSEAFCDLLETVATNRSNEVDMSEVQLASLATKNCRCFYAGDFSEQFGYIGEIRDLYDVARHSGMILNYGMDIFAAAQMFEPVARAITGQGARVADLISETDAHQDLLGIPVMRPYALIWGAVPLFYAGHQAQAQQRLAQGISEADNQGAMFWQVTGRVWQGVMHPALHESPEAMANMRGSIDTLNVMGVGIGRSYFEAVHARALSLSGDTEAAQLQSARAAEECETSRLLCWYPEILRLHALNCAASGREEQAHEIREKGRLAAQAQGAALWELRLLLDMAPGSNARQQGLADLIAKSDATSSGPEIDMARQALAVTLS